MIGEEQGNDRHPKRHEGKRYAIPEQGVENPSEQHGKYKEQCARHNKCKQRAAADRGKGIHGTARRQGVVHPAQKAEYHNAHEQPPDNVVGQRFSPRCAFAPFNSRIARCRIAVVGEFDARAFACRNQQEQKRRDRIEAKRQKAPFEEHDRNKNRRYDRRRRIAVQGKRGLSTRESHSPENLKAARCNPAQHHKRNHTDRALPQNDYGRPEYADPDHRSRYRLEPAVEARALGNPVSNECCGKGAQGAGDQKQPVRNTDFRHDERGRKA